MDSYTLEIIKPFVKRFLGVDEMAISVPVPPEILRHFYVCWARDESHNILCFAPDRECIREFVWGAFKVRIPICKFPLQYSVFRVGTVSDYNRYCFELGLYNNMIHSAYMTAEFEKDV